ncbi:hypothetical protein [Nitrosococcus oceani]|nr:hypothetical protein [Nitrosococcus oceani]
MYDDPLKRSGARGPSYLPFAMSARYDFPVATSATYPREEET